MLLSTGETITVATRERPKLFFQNGVPTHLVNGVSSAPSCAPKACAECKTSDAAFPTYTLVAPLVTATSKAAAAAAAAV